MDAFSYHDGQLYAEDMPLSTIAAQVSTPCYVYSRSMIENQWRAFDNAFAGRDHLVCYAVKANPNLAILNLLARLGSGFDIVSGGELERVLRGYGIRNVLIGGTKTNVCCESTGRDAMMLDFNVVMVTDCLAALSDDEHRASLETFIQQFGDVMSGDEVLAVLRNKPN